MTILVIDRKDQDKIKVFIGDIEFTMIIALEKGKAKLIFDAPRSVEIWRLELLEDGKRPQRNSDGKRIDTVVETPISINGGPYDGV
jgi:sRNA-binding carbon storage regulator CsrA